jgi:hypothetical protein
VIEPVAAPAPTKAAAWSGWYLAVALTIGAVALAFAVRRVDWGAFAAAVGGVSIGWLALGALGTVAAQLLVAIRWHVLVNAGDRLPLADAFDFVMIGALGGLALTSRLGDLARAVAAGRFRGLSASRLLGTVLVERLFDVLMLLGFGAALAVLMPIPPIVQAALLTLFVAAVALALVLWLGGGGPLGIVRRWIARIAGPASSPVTMFTRFVDGIAAVRHEGRVAPALVAALLVWSCSAAAAACNLAAFGIQAPWYAGAFVVIVVNLGGLVPAPPAGIGVYDFLAMLALSPWASDSSTAFAFALVTHAVSVAVVMTLGSASLVRKGLSLAAVRRMAAAEEPRIP